MVCGGGIHGSSYDLAVINHEISVRGCVYLLCVCVCEVEGG